MFSVTLKNDLKKLRSNQIIILFNSINLVALPWRMVPYETSIKRDNLSLLFIICKVDFDFQKIF